MIDDYQQILSSLCLSLPDKSKIQQPMSRKAKRLLADMLEWSRPYHGKLWRGTPDFIREFYVDFNPLGYEYVCHCYRVDQHLTALKKSKAGVIPGPHKTKSDILSIMQLRHFDDMDWIREQNLLDNGKQVGNIRSLRAQMVYDWLTTHFLITDFTEDDLNRIVMLGDEKFDFETIKSEANKIKDVDKRSMAYLYAIIRDVTVKEEYARHKTAEIHNLQDLKLQTLIKQALESKNKLVHKFPPNAHDHWALDITFLDLVSSLKY